MAPNAQDPTVMGSAYETLTGPGEAPPPSTESLPALRKE